MPPPYNNKAKLPYAVLSALPCLVLCPGLKHKPTPLLCSASACSFAVSPGRYDLPLGVVGDGVAAASMYDRCSPGVRRRCRFLLGGRLRGGLVVVRRQLRDQRRRGPRQDLPRRPDLVPLPRQEDGRRVPDEAEVPVRVVQHEAQARRQRLRRRRHRLLHVLGPGRGAGARRAGLRVPGQPDGAALHHPDQRVPQRRRRPGDAPLALVRPHRRLPHLLHPLEPQADRVFRGQGADPRVPQLGQAQQLLPDHEAHVRLLQHLERRRLGDARRPREDGLDQGAIRLHLPRLHRRRVLLGPSGRAPAQLRRRHRRQLVGPAAGVGARRRPARGLRLGGEEPRDIRLLR